jgi:hypothetical protein
MATRPHPALILTFLGAAAMHTASAFLYTLSSHSFVCSHASALHASQVGIPGAGKSTGSAVLSSLLDESVVVIPVDGFHHYMAELRSRPDADAAIYRRGACVAQCSSLVFLTSAVKNGSRTWSGLIGGECTSTILTTCGNKGLALSTPADIVRSLAGMPCC